MKISTKGRYALRIMLDLASFTNGEYVSLKDIGTRQDISVKYMEQIIPLLCRAGLLSSLRGNNGGYRLTKSPDQYRVGEILRTTEGSLAPVACLEDKTNQCDRAAVCPTLEFWEGLYKVINQYVDSVTLLDLKEKEQSFIDYYI